jgi:hypothetical protein
MLRPLGRSVQVGRKAHDKRRAKRVPRKRAKHALSSVLIVLEYVQVFGAQNTHIRNDLRALRWTFSAIRWTFPAVAVDVFGGLVDVFGQLSTA